ncbi:hypothetical protein HS7_17850 [Sulfolobales archaeon HS-7]|nr:hypothetical protein HS7_17850 [Sulfolobales archaeon HS-7]
MSIRMKGTNAYGHSGWLTHKCVICSRSIRVGGTIIYTCPKDAEKLRAYFCEADARNVKYKCPFCGEQLITI